MSDGSVNIGPPPAWVGEPLVQPGERVIVWGGPREGRVKRWLRDRIGLLKVKKLEGLLMIPYFAALPAFGFAGKGLFRLLGLGNGEMGLFLGLGLALGWCFALLGALIWSEQASFHVLTERRLLVIKNFKLVQAFELDHMRRMLAAVDATRPVAVPTDEHVLDPSKVRPLLAPTGQGVTEIEPILRLLRAFGQLQAPPSA